MKDKKKMIVTVVIICVLMLSVLIFFKLFLLPTNKNVTDAVKPEIVYKSDEKGPESSILNTKAWLDFSKSEFFVEYDKFEWEISVDNYRGYCFNPEYNIEVIYFPDDGTCTIDIIDCEDWNNTICSFGR